MSTNLNAWPYFGEQTNLTYRSKLVGLARITLQNYSARGEGHLVRGVDCLCGVYDRWRPELRFNRA